MINQAINRICTFFGNVSGDVMMSIGWLLAGGALVAIRYFEPTGWLAVMLPAVYLLGLLMIAVGTAALADISFFPQGQRYAGFPFNELRRFLLMCFFCICAVIFAWAK